MKKILIVEDSIEIIELIKIYLEQEGYSVITASDGASALKMYDKNIVDLVILDIMLPIINGYEVIKHIRKKSTIPIIILSAKSLDNEKILGLNLGADDYITKPFNPLELTARINAQLRRFNNFESSNERKKELINIHNLTLNTVECKLYKNDQEINLTSTEYKLIKFFMNNPGRVFTKEQLYEEVWKNDYFTDNTITVYISKLREKIEQDSKNPLIIKTIRGLGYKFEK